MTWLISLLTAAILTPVIRSFAINRGVVAHPNPLIPQHTRPIAYLGGLAVAAAAGVGLLTRSFFGFDDARPIEEIVRGIGGFSMGLSRPWGAIVFCSFLYLGVGILDDLKTFRPRAKLLLQILVATTAVSAGLRAPLTAFPMLDSCLTVFWMVAMVNAVNFMDVHDGLVSGTAAIFLAGGALILGGAPHWLAFAGAALGFLLYNRPQASIFLGDAGSHLFGFLAAALGVAIIQVQGPWPGFLSLGLLLVLPLFELVFVVIVRLLRRVPIWLGSRDHVALRLAHRGFRPWGLLACMWGFGAVGAIASLQVEKLSASGQQTLAVGASLTVITIGLWLGRIAAPPPDQPQGSQGGGKQAPPTNDMGSIDAATIPP